MNEEKEDIEYLRKYINWETHGERNLEKAIKTILDLYDRNEKIMYKMAKLLKADSMHPRYGRNEEEVIKYFREVK